MVPMAERMVFEALKATLQVHEPSRTSTNLRYTWDNYRADEARVLARLDRFYTYSSPNLASTHVLSYRIRGDAGWSDHLPIEMTIQVQAGPKRSSRWHMSTHNLQNALPELTRLWHSQPPGRTFFSKIKDLTRTYCRICKEKAANLRQELLQAREAMEHATEQLHSCPTNSLLQQTHGTCRQALQTIETRLMEGRRSGPGSNGSIKET